MCHGVPAIGQVGFCHFIEQPHRFGGVMCRARQHGGMRRPVTGEARQDFSAQKVAPQVQCSIGGVFNPCQLMLLRIGMQRRTRKTKQGSHDLTVTEDGLCRHGGKASDSRAAQQLQEHRFFLVITMVGSEQSVSRLERHCQRRITRASRSRLQPFFRYTCNPYTFNNILNIERGADTCAMPAPLGRGRLQVVINVDGAERKVMICAQDGKRMQQDMRIKAAAIGYLEVRTGRKMQLVKQHRSQRGG